MSTDTTAPDVCPFCKTTHKFGPSDYCKAQAASEAAAAALDVAAGLAEPLGYIVIKTDIVGDLEDWQHVFSWDGKRHASQQEAIDRGCRMFDHDDFNLGRVAGNRLVWFGWQGEELADFDRAEIAAAIGLTADSQE